MKTSRRVAAFTLIEMLVVMIVIALLMGILLPVIQGARAKARRQMQQVQIGEIEKAIEEFRKAFGVYPPSYVTVIPQRDNTNAIVGPDAWYPIIEPLIGGDGICNTAATPDDLQRVVVGASALPGQIVVDVGGIGGNGVLDTPVPPPPDDVVVTRNYFLDNAGTPVDLNAFDATRVDQNDPDLDGVALDGAECLYYFLCMRFAVNPGADFTSANFISSTWPFLQDPTTFEFQPGPNLAQANAGPFYGIKGHEVRDTDGDGYLELCDLYGNPLQYVLTPPWMIVERAPPAGNGQADSDILLPPPSDDRQLTPFGAPAGGGQVIVHPGPNWVLQEAVDASEVAIMKRWTGGKPALVYSLGPNGQDNLGMSDGPAGGKNRDDDGDNVMDNEDDISNQ